MLDKKRRVTSIVLISAIILTLVSALMIKNGFLVLLCIIIEFCAYVWYMASYIPFARKSIVKCLTLVVK